MIDCCELALHNAKLALYLGLGAFVVISLLLAMFFNYSLKLKAKSIELSKRTTVLEKKNGKELAEIERLKVEIGKLESTIRGGQHE